MWSSPGFVCCLGVTLTLLLFLSPVHARNAKRKRTKIWQGAEGKCVPITNKDSSIRFRCPPKNVIYSISINSYNSSACNAVGSCSGLQPSVLTESNMCYFKRSCTIYYNNMAPIVKTSDTNCIGRTPASLYASYLCVKRGLYRVVQGGEKRLIQDYGILVSHNAYPWHYKKGIDCNLTLTPKTAGKTKLYVSVPVIELDHMDIVRMTNNIHGMKYVNITKKTEDTALIFKPNAESTVMLSFRTDQNSSTTKGFIICFWWAGEDEDLQNICSKMTTKRKNSRNKSREKKHRKNKQKKKSQERKRKKKGKRKITR